MSDIHFHAVILINIGIVFPAISKAVEIGHGGGSVKFPDTDVKGSAQYQ